MFGQSGAVAPLVNYLTSSSIEVHRSTSVALYQLSKDPWNCVTMHQNGVVPHLLRLIGNVHCAVIDMGMGVWERRKYVFKKKGGCDIPFILGSEDEDVQEASADCLQNIRKLALACEFRNYIATPDYT